MGVGLRKIAGDLRHARSQALMLFAAILVGQALMTAAFMARSVIASEIERNYAMTASPDVTIDAYGIEVQDLSRFERVAGIGKIDVLSVVSGRYRQRDGSWRAIMIYGRRDFADQRVSKIFRKAGQWPSAPRNLLIEQSGTGIAGKELGDEIQVQFGRGKRLDLTYTGVVHDAAQAPSWQENTVYGYVPLGTVKAALDNPILQLRIILTPDATPATVAKDVSAIVTNEGGRVGRVNLVPATHPHADLMNGLLILLAIFSILSFAVAICLAASIVAGLAQRQERQMAVLRALGASRRKIAILHLGFALAPAVPGLLLGAVLGQAGATLLQAAVANQLNIEVGSGPPPTGIRDVLLIAGAIGVVTALIVPVMAASRKSVRQILQSGLRQLRKPRLAVRMFRPLDQLAIAEAFQRPVRASITVMALTLAGAALLSSANAFSSLVSLVDRMADSRHDDIEVVLSDPPDNSKLARGMARIEGVRRYELWDRKAVNLDVDGQTVVRLPILSPSPATRMGLPRLVAGKWPAGEGEIAISQMAAAFNPLLRQAFDQKSSIQLSFDGGKTQARIVGLTDEWGPGAWTSKATFDAIATPRDRARDLRIIVEPGRVAAVQQQLDAAITAANSFPTLASSKDDRRTVMVNHFYSFYQFLLIAGLGAAFIGGIALSASIGSSVLERVREIGIIKTLGADSAALFRLVLVQAAATTTVSLVLAALLAWPLSLLLTKLIKDFALHMNLELVISTTALGLLTAGSIIMAVMAAVAPAIRIKSMTVREAITAE